MHALIVFAHPEPNSFNGALRDVAIETLGRRGYEVEVSDLHAEGFDPVEKADHYLQRVDANAFSAMAEQRHASDTLSLPHDVEREIDRLERADLVILQFPLWWHSQPAMLKGWFDRVFVAGKLYTSKMRYDRGYFRGKTVICSVTTGAPEVAFQGNGRGGDMEKMLYPIQYSLNYMGFTVLPAFAAYGVQNLSGFYGLQDDQLVQHLEGLKLAWARRLEELGDSEPVPFPGWDDWDEHGHPVAERTGA